jgi:hypothetical protein
MPLHINPVWNCRATKKRGGELGAGRIVAILLIARMCVAQVSARKNVGMIYPVPASPRYRTAAIAQGSAALTASGPVPCRRSTGTGRAW